MKKDCEMRMNSFDIEQKRYWDKNVNYRDVYHPIVEFFSKQRIDFIKTIIPLDEISNAIEVGCGDGFGLYFFEEYFSSVSGCDFSYLMLKTNISKKSKLIQADAYHLPYKNHSFDLVYCWELLHHLNNPIDAIIEMKRVGKKYLLLIEPNALNPLQFLFGLSHKEERGTIRFTKKYLEQILTAAELDNYRIYNGGWLTPNRTPKFYFDLVKNKSYQTKRFGLSNLIVVDLKNS